MGKGGNERASKEGSMIEVGHQGRARGLGGYEVQKRVQLKEPEEYYDDEGKKFFHPILAQIKWKNTGNVELWLTYYRQREGKKPRFAGQFAPIMREDSLVEVLSGAIDQGFFAPHSLSILQQAISVYSTRTKGE